MPKKGVEVGGAGSRGILLITLSVNPLIGEQAAAFAQRG